MDRCLFLSLLDSVHSRCPDRWIGFIDQITQERALICKALDSGTIRSAYGFTTLLGPMDRVKSFEDYQKILLRSHLVGNPKAISVELMLWITAAKLEILSNGGSGISAESYCKVLDFFENGRSCSIDLDASYSSGDVVPAAWWIRSVFSDDLSLPKGDLIALMNGYFVSLGVASYTVFQYIGFCSSLLSCMSQLRMRSGWTSEEQKGIVKNLGLDDISLSNPPQPSVLARDVYPVLDLIFSSILDSIETLERSYRGKSCNPIFLKLKPESTLLAYSNSSFLNFNIPKMHAQLEYCISALARVSYLLISNICDKHIDELSERESLKYVQPPKVALGYCISIESQSSGIGQLAGSESKGVEDLWDTGLMRGVNLLRQLRKAGTCIKILNECLEGVTHDKIKAFSVGEMIAVSKNWKNW